jgi:hypothetical protein
MVENILYRGTQAKSVLMQLVLLVSIHYVLLIDAIQVPESGTGMPDEVNYSPHLATYEEAMTVLYPQEASIVKYAYALYQTTKKYKEDVARRDPIETEETQTQPSKS